MNALTEQGSPDAGGGTIINAGAVIAVLLAIPSFFIGVFGAVGFITGQKLVAGGLGAAWGYAAVLGAYELNRRKFHWQRGRQHRDLHLLAGSAAAAFGLVLGGALRETLPALALVPALSAIKQANRGHPGHWLAWIHLAIIAAGVGGGYWFYTSAGWGEYVLGYLGSLP